MMRLVALLSFLCLVASTCDPSPPPDPNRLGLVILGQSNAVGQGFTLTISTTVSPSRAWNGFAWVKAVDPLHGNGGGSPYPALGDGLAGQVDFVPTAVSGTGLVDPPQWGAVGVYWNQAVAEVANSQVQVDAVLWVQGETDALNDVGYAEYRAALEALADRVCLEWEAPLVVAVIPNIWPGFPTTKAEIQAASIDVAASHHCACPGPDLRVYPLPDQTHVKHDADIADLAIQWRAALEDCGVI